MIEKASFQPELINPVVFKEPALPIKALKIPTITTLGLSLAACGSGPGKTTSINANLATTGALPIIGSNTNDNNAVGTQNPTAELNSDGGIIPPPIPSTESDMSQTNVNTSSDTSLNYLQTLTDTQAARFLQQAQFSSTPKEIANLKSLGIEKWLSNQMAMPISVTGFNWLMNEYLTYYRYKNQEFKSSQYPKYAQQMIYHQLITQPDGLRKRVALALSEIFVVSDAGVDLAYISAAIASYWDTLNKHAFGNFRELLGAVTFHPLMGEYLDTLGNAKGDLVKGTAADENFAREVLQLFTIGLYELNIDGSVKMGNNGKPIETYDNSTITNLAKVFTGFILGNLNSADAITATPETHLLPMRINPAKHDTSTKTIFGKVVPSGTTPEQEINNALDIIFQHPNVGPFISRLLIQRLTSSNPSPSYIRRVAQVFNNNGKGVRGDLAAVIKAILIDIEARRPNENDVFCGKVREPMITWVQWLRTFTNRVSKTGHWTLMATTSNQNALNQSPFKSPSVFNFFEPDYIPTNPKFAEADKVAPEMYLIDENSIAAYQNFFLWFYVREGVWSSNGNGIMELSADYTEYLPLASQPQALVEKLNLVLAGNRLNANAMSIIINAIKAIPKTEVKYNYTVVSLAAFLTVISPSYRVQV